MRNLSDNHKLGADTSLRPLVELVNIGWEAADDKIFGSTGRRLGKH